MPDNKLNWDIYSGWTVTRRKWDLIPHPAIILGRDEWFGELWIVHNQIDAGRPILEPLRNFGPIAEWIPPQRDPQVIIQNAIVQWQESRQYDMLSNNCQHFASEASTGVRESSSLQKVGAVVGGLVLGALIGSLLEGSSKRRVA